MIQPIIKGEFKIQKMEMKGGWHFITLPHHLIQKSMHPFGWIIVKGSVDQYSINQFKLWPTKEGKLFLPLKKEIRKAIQKEAGDTVIVELYEDHTELQIPVEFALCLADAPKANLFFETLSSTSKKQYIDWIYSAKTKPTIENRIVTTIEQLEKGLKYHEKII